jgi:hypothetical protein
VAACCSFFRLARRGGNWNNNTNAGVFYLSLNNYRSNNNHNFGARPAFVEVL